jgi:hypothetical protein
MSGPFIGTPNAELGLIVHGISSAVGCIPIVLGAVNVNAPHSSGVDRLPTIGEF